MTRILLVEDDLDACAALAATLTEAPTSARVTTAHSVIDALGELARGDYDAAVVDLALDGPAETLHDAIAFRGVPTLVLSGTRADELPEHAQRHGWSYLAKPASAAALHDAIDRLLDQPSPRDSTPMDTPPTPPTATAPRQRVVVAAPVPVAVQVVDKIGELAAVLAFCLLAYHGKLSGEWAVAGSLAALGVQSIPRGILAARTSGPTGAGLGLIGLGLLGALHTGDADRARIRGETMAGATSGVLAILVLLGVLVMQGCGPAREALVDTQSPRVDCRPGSQRCYARAPEVCSATGRWWAVLPVAPDGSPRVCADVCEVRADGVAHCASSTVVMP